MLFNSLAFAVFFPVVTAGYFLLPFKYRKWWLLAASCWFYMAFVPVYILILAFTIAVDFAAGLLIERSEGRRRKGWLIASIVANVGVLAVFKYWNFLNHNIGEVFREMGLGYGVPDLGMLLPIGLSFHTFQSLSYTIEVYRRKQKAERAPGTFALYVMFYPQLVAGPIERPANLLNQLHLEHRWEDARVVSGLKLMLWGFFKKMVIADRCGEVVDTVYNDLGHHDGASIVLATYLFALRIYCDFSGYTDIAIGAARVMGFDLMENFRTPYLSASISEFWSRWHISLSSWFRDYLYIPLGGNRVGRARLYFNLLFVFLVSGLWHGANWTFVIWGGLHGVYLVLALLCAPMWAWFAVRTGRTLWRWVHVLITFHLVLLGWVFFRAANVSDAFLALRKMTGVVHDMKPGVLQELGPAYVALTLFLALVFLCIDPRMDDLVKRRTIPLRRPWSIALFSGVAAAVLLFGYFGKTAFIYFQF